MTSAMLEFETTIKKAIFEFYLSRNVAVDVTVYNEFDGTFVLFCEVVTIDDYDVDLRVISSVDTPIEFKPETSLPIVKVPLEDVTEITWTTL